MPKRRGKIAGRAGLPPGALVYTGERRDEASTVTTIEYDQTIFEEKTADLFSGDLPPAGNTTVTWIKTVGLQRVENLERLGKCFKIHPLILEDILHTELRPKVEDLDDYLYLQLKTLRYDQATDEVGVEQIGMVLGENYLLSFQEREDALFAPILDRLRSGQGRLRRATADYLAYSLMDTVIDNYFVIVEKIGDRIEILEDELAGAPTLETLHSIHQLRREVIVLRRAIWPLREVIAILQRGESRLVRAVTTIYLRDLYDHTVQLLDTLETLRDMLTGSLDLYLSSISNRLNSVMKVLTVIATIFMPLSFIAGVYGMNFHYMPELEWRWGYPAALLLMLAIALGMLVGFRVKKWL